MASPTSRTLAYVRRAGWLACVVEKWVPLGKKDGADAKPGVRRDAFGFGDILAVHAGQKRTLMIQATALSGVPSRVNKIQGKTRDNVHHAVAVQAAGWLAAGNEIQVWGWYKRGEKWLPKIVVITASDLSEMVLVPIVRKRKRDKWRPGELFGG